MATLPTNSPPSSRDALLAQLDDLASTIAPAATKDSRAPLGLPKETLAAQHPGFSPYIEGDEWNPQSLGPADKRRLQLVMERSGLLQERGYSPTVWDARSAQAWKQVLALANSRGDRDTEAALAEYASAAQTYGTNVKAPRAPLVTRLADPAAVRDIVRDSSFKLLGRRLSDSDEQRIISSYQSQLAAYQQAAYQAEEGGGTVIQPDVQSQVTAALESGYGPEVEMQRASSFMDKVVALGPKVARPTIKGGS